MGSQTPSAKPEPSEIAVYSIKLDRAKLERFKLAAESHQRTAAQQIRWLIDREIREHEADAA